MQCLKVLGESNSLLNFESKAYSGFFSWTWVNKCTFFKVPSKYIPNIPLIYMYLFIILKINFEWASGQVSPMNNFDLKHFHVCNTVWKSGWRSFRKRLVKSPCLSALNMFVVQLIWEPRIDILVVSSHTHVFVFSLRSFVFHADNRTYAPKLFIMSCWDLYDNSLCVSENKGTFASGEWGPSKIPETYLLHISFCVRLSL